LHILILQLKQPDMVTSISSKFKSIQDMKLFKVFFLAVFLLGFINSKAFAQCTVTGVSGSETLLAGQCAPVLTAVGYTFTFGTVAPPQASYTVMFFWGDGVIESKNCLVQSKIVFGLTVYYVNAELPHTFPATGLCEYNVEMFLIDNGFKCNDSKQIQIIANWHQDDYAPANGVINLNPTPRRDVCVGLPLVDFRFADASRFACNLQQYPLAQKPNHTTRYQQFVYGTNPVAGGIPNLSIKVGTAQTVVVLTDNNGVPIPGPWSVDPTTGGAVAPYNTQSGYFEGPIVPVPLNAVSGVYTLPSTYPISFNGVGTAFMDQFQVTVRNWNVCNPWNGNTANPNVSGPEPIANIATALIYIINGPLANAGPDDAICSGSTYTMNGSVTNATSSLWTNTSGSSARFTNPTNPGSAVYNPTNAERTAGFVDLVLHAYAAGGCTEHTDIMRLTIDPIPAQPTITLTGGPNGFCDDNSTSLTLTSSASPNSNYLWTPTSINNQSITLNDYTQSGNYTVTVYGNTPRACPRTSAAFTVTIGQPAIVDAGPVAATICSTPAYTTAGSFGGSATSAIWTTSGDGTFGNANNPITAYTPGTSDISTGTVTLTLTTNDPVGTCLQVSDNITLTIIKAPVINAGSDAAICQGSTYQVTDAAATNYNTIAWTETGAGVISAGAGTLTPTYTPVAADYGNSVTLTLTATGNGPCATVIDTKVLYIDRTPVATVGAAQNICGAVTAVATLSGNNGGTDLSNGATGIWRFTDTWMENFTGLNGQGIDVGPTSWSRTVNLAGAGSLSQVVASEKYRVTNNQTVWTTGNINITGQANIGIFVDFSSYSTGNGFEATDIIQARYILDGVPNLFYSTTGAVDGTTGAPSVPLKTFQATASAINGNNMVIQITLYSNVNDEIYEFDNVTVRKDGSTVINNPTSATTTVTNLSQGANLFTWTVSSAHGGCTPAAANLSITRDNPPATAAAGTDQALCETNSTTLAGNVVTNGGTGLWTHTSGPAGYAITTPTANNSTVTNLDLGTHVFRWTITGALGICTSFDEVSITRNPNPLDRSGNVTIVKTPVCYNTAGQLQITNTEANVRYYLRTGGVDGSYVQGNGGTITLTTPNLTSATIYQIHAIKDVTGCNIIFGSYTINVNPQFTLAQLATSHNICNGFSTTISVTLTGGTSPYSITINNGIGVINNYVSGTPITTPNLVATTTYSITAVADANSCTPASFGTPITVTVGSTPTAATLSGTSDACIGATSSLTVTVSDGVSPYDLIINGVAYNDHISGNSITLGALPQGANTYTLSSVIDNCNNPVPILNLPAPYTININPYPNAAGTVNNTPVICNDGTTDIVLYADVPNSDFIWTVSNLPAVTWQGGKAPLGGTRVSGEGSSIAQNLAHNGTAQVTVTYTIRPRGPGATACLGAPITRDVVVNPSGQVNDPSDQVVCNGGSTTLVTFGTDRTGGTTTYLWSNNTPSIGLAASGTTNTIPSFVAANTGTAPVIATITVTPTFTNGGVSCSGTAQTFIINVNPSAQVNDPADQVVCNGGSTTLVTFGTDRTGGTTTYSWSNNTPSINLAASGTTNTIPSFIAANAGTAPVTATITVTPTFTNGGVSCTGTAQSFTITVNPSAQVNDPSDQVVCNGGSTTLVTFGTNRTGGTTTYSWSNNTPSINLAASGTTNTISSFVAVNTGSAPVIATITVTPTFTNGGVGCTGTAQTFTITVNPSAQVNDPADQVVCNGGSTTLVTFGTDRTGGTTTYSWSNNTPSIGLAASGTTNTIPSFVAANTGSAPVIATITVTPTFTNGGVSCAGTAQSFTITVNPTAQVNDPADQVVCNGVATALVTFGTDRTGGTTTYSWSNNTPSIGLAASGITNTIPSFTAVNNGTAIVIATITVTPTFTNGGTGCTGTAQSFTLTVNPTATLSSTQAPADVCSSTLFSYTPTTATAGTSFSWTRLAATGITPAGPVSGTNSVSEILVNITSLPIPVTYRYTLQANSCNNVQDVVVNIKPEPVITSSQTPSVCSGIATNYKILLNNFTNPADNVTFTWNAPVLNPVDAAFSGGADRLVPSFANIINTFTNTMGIPGTATYIVTPTYNGCTGTPQTIVLTVNPQPVITSGLTETICSGGMTNLAITTSNVPALSGVTYTWPAPIVTGGITGGTGRVVGSGLPITDTYTNLTGIDQTATYTVTPLYNGCSGNPRSVVITVRPPIIPGSITGNTSICYNTDAPIISSTGVASGGDGVITYSWYFTETLAAVQGDGSWAIIPLATGSSYDPGVLINPTKFVRKAKDGSCTNEVYSNMITIGIYPLPLTSPITGNAIICQSATNQVYQVTTPRTVGSTYAWTVPAGLTITSPPGLYFIIVDATGPTAPGAKLTVTETLPGPTFCTGLPVEFPIIVSPTKAQEVVSGPSPVCEGSTLNHYSVSTTAGSTYSWSLPPGAFITSNPALSGIDVTFPLNLSGQVSVVETNGACTIFHLPLPVTVNPRPVLSSSLTPPAICSGTSFDYTATSASASPTFAWSRTGILGINGGTGSAGAGNVSEVLTNTTTAPISVTYVYTTTAAGCTGNPQNVVVVVNPSGQANDPADMVLCNGSSTTAIIFGTNNSGGSTTYTWTNTATGIGLSASGTGNIASFTATNSGTAPVIATITVTPTFTNGTVSCVGTDQIFTITVNPTAQVTDPANQVVCNNSLTTLVTFATLNTVGTTTYTWTNSIPAIGLAASGSGPSIPAFTASNTTTASVVATISVTPHFLNGTVTCDGPAQTFTITVNPTGQINDPADQLVCNGAPVTTVTFTSNNTGGTTTYAWTNNTPAIGLAANGSGNITSFTAVNAGTSQVTATITVTPTFTNGTVSCPGTSETFTIIVNPSGKVDDPADQVLCNGSPIAPVTFTTSNIDGVTTYSWTNTASGIGLAASGTGDIASFNAVNTGNSPVVATITVTPHYTNGSLTCTGAAQTFTITVNPTGQVNDPADQVVCNGASTMSVNFTTNNTVGATTYSWTNSTSGFGLPASGIGNIASFPAVNLGTSPVTATITVTPHFNNGAPICDGPVQTFTITVNPTAQMNDPADQVVCNGASTSTVVFGTTTTGGTTNYTWTNDLTSIGLGASGSGNIPFFTATNGGTAPVTANITVTPHFTNGSVICDGPPMTFTITVNPNGQVNDPANQVVCNGAPVTAVTFGTLNTIGTTTYSWTNSATGIGLVASGSGDIASFTAINTGTSPVVATIVVTPHFLNGSVTCDGTPQSFTITVNPTAQVNDPADQVVCNGAPVTAVSFGTINTGGATTYAWTNTATGIGLPATGSGNIGSFLATNSGTAPVVATITVTPTFTNGSVSCAGTSENFTITVNPTGQVNDPADQVVCNGGSTAAVTFGTLNTVGITTYSWTNSAPGIGLAASGLGDIASFTASNITIAPIVATITVTPHYANGSVTCNGPVQTFNITVNPSGHVNDPANQVVCNGSATAAINFTTNNTGGTTTYSWTNDNTTINLPANGTGNILSFIAANSGTSPVTATITVTPHFDNGLPLCDGPVQTFTITVNPTGQVNIPSDQVVCKGSSTTTVIFGTVNTGGTTTYTWTNSAPGIGLAASGSGNITAFSATNSGTSPLVATIAVTPHFANGSVTCNGPIQTFIITVNPTAQVNDPANQVVCNGLPVAPVNFVTVNSGGTTSFNWVNDNPGIGLSASGTGNILTFNGINTGTSPEVATIIVTPGFDNGSVTCTGPSQSFTITVNPAGQVNDPADQVVCNGSMTTPVALTTGNSGGSTTYTWANDNTTIGLGATGTGNIPTFAAANTGISPVVATITVTPHFAYGSVTCDGPVQTFTITVNPTAHVTDPANQVVCNGLPTTPVAFTTNNLGGTITYNWTNNATAIGLAANGSGNIASFNAVNSGTSPVVATITVTPSFDNSSVACSGPSQTFTITVNPTGQVNVPANQIVCNGSLSIPVTFTTTNTGGTTTYSWVNDNPAIGLGAGASGNIAAFSATNATMSPIVANITVTPHYTNGSVTCDGTAETFTITVNPSGNVVDPGDQALCNGETTSVVTFTTGNGGGTTTYSWTNSAPGIGLAASGTGDIAPFTASNITSAPVVATITVTPHFTNGTVTCNGPVQTFTITVNPTAQVNDPANQTVCDGSGTTTVIFGTLNSGGTTAYNWVNDNTAIGLAASGTGDIISFPATNGTTAPISGTITVTPAFTNGLVTCTGPVQTFTITVNPAGQVNDPADQVVCAGSSTATVIFGTLNTGGSTTYSWTNDLPSIGLAASGTGSIPFFTSTNAGTAPVTATITVTPHYTNNSVTCDGTPQTFTITVNPKGQVNDPVDQVVCNALPVAAVNFTTNNTGGTTTYTWVNNTPSIGLVASGTGPIIAFNAINTGTSPVVATITVTPHFDNGAPICDGIAQTFTITVNPTGQVNDPADQVVCNGAPVSAINFSTLNLGGTTTYSWTNTTPGIGLAVSGTGNIATFNAVNSGTAPVVATITVIPHFANGSVTCDGPVQTFTITVNPTAQVNDPADQVVCNGFPTAAITFITLNTVGTTTYTWTNSASGIGLPASGSGDIALFNAVNTGTTPIVASIVVTPHFDNGSVTCNGPSQTFTITVNPTAQVNDPANQVICNTDNISVTFTTASSGGLTTYSWINSAPGIGLSASGTGNIASFNATNSTTAPVIATITVTPSFTNASVSCAGPDQTFTITVNPTGQVTDPADQVVCNGSFTAPVAFVTLNTGGTTTYTWTNTATGIGLPASGTGNISAFQAINTGTLPVTATITVTPHFSNNLVNCDGPAETFTITVNPSAQVTDPADQVVCNGAPVTAVNFITVNTGGITTYAWINSAPGIGLPASGTGNIALFNALNIGTTPIVATITVTPAFDNGSVTCTGTAQTFTITVNPTGQVNKPANQVVCNGSTSAAVTFATGNSGGTTTYDWVNDSPGIGLAASGSGSIAAFTAINSGITPVVATITVTPHFANGSVTCTGPNETFTITVNPTPTVSTASPLTICSASNTNVVLTGNVAGAAFSWTVGSVTGSISGASASSGSTISQILINSGTTQGQVTYVVIPTANSCAGTPVNIIVTVNPVPNVTTLGPTTICSGATTNIALNSNVGGTTFNWTIGTITGTIAGAAPAGGATIAQILTNTGTTAGTVEYIVTPIANSCPGIPVTVVITVNPTPDVLSAGLTTICSSTTTNISLTSGVAGTTFSWTIGGVTGGVSGATASNGTTIAQTLYNPGLAPGIVTYIVTPTANSCSGTATSIVITVNPLTGPTSFTSGAIEVCQDAPDEIYTATAVNSTSIVFSVLPAAAGVINPATGIMDWDAAFSGTATITATSAGLCGTTVGTLSVRVKELPGIDSDPVDAVTCEFGVVNFDVTATGSDITYRWYVDENTGTFIPVPTGGIYSGETSPTLQIWSPVRSMNNYKYRVVISGCLPDVTSLPALLTVNTAPELTVHPSDQTICLGDNTTINADATGTSVTWEWWVNKGAGFVLVTPDANFSGETTKTLTITGALATFNTWIFRAKATGVCGVPAFTNFGRLSVINPPAVTLQPSATPICENGSTSFLGNGSNYIGLQWQVSTNGGGTFTNITDDAMYVGSVTNQLSIMNAPVTINTYQYRLGLIGACTTIYTNAVTLTVNPNPVVNFAADINACGGIPIVINGNPSGGTAPYTQHRWTGAVGPLSSYTNQSPTFNSLISGTYNLNYRVTDSNLCTANDDVTVIVDSPSADFTQSVDMGCTPLEVTFTKDMTGIDSFSWDFDDGSPAETGVASPTHTFINTNTTTIGYYNVELTVSSSGGCTATATRLVTVFPAVDASFTTSDDSICSGSQLKFTALPGASTYSWDFGDGTPAGSGLAPTHLYLTTGAPVTRTVQLITTSFYGCTDTTTLNIVVMPLPAPQFFADPPSQVFDPAGNTVNFTNQTLYPGSFTYTWDFGDGNTSLSTSTPHTYTSGIGTFNVTLEATNGICTVSITRQITIVPEAPVADFVQPQPACSPLSITFENTSLHTDTPGTSYSWDFGDGNYSTDKNPSYTYFNAGIYVIELTVTGPGGTDIITRTVEVYASPRANFEVSPTLVFVNDEKVRCFNLSQDADYYLWEFGDGDTSKVKDPFHKYMVSGVYDITLWAYSVNGCSNKYVLSPGVTVEPAGEIRFATVFTPNKDGPQESNGRPSGDKIDQFFFPPLQEQVVDYKLQIFNRLGFLIFESRDINIAWNGYYKGKLCAQGVYVWYVEGKYKNGQPFKKVGDVTLLH
jgi:hypothetical protein